MADRETFELVSGLYAKIDNELGGLITDKADHHRDFQKQLKLAQHLHRIGWRISTSVQEDPPRIELRFWKP